MLLLLILLVLFIFGKIVADFFGLFIFRWDSEALFSLFFIVTIVFGIVFIGTSQ